MCAEITFRETPSELLNISDLNNILYFWLQVLKNTNIVVSLRTQFCLSMSISESIHSNFVNILNFGLVLGFADVY